MRFVFGDLLCSFLALQLTTVSLDKCAYITCDWACINRVCGHIEFAYDFKPHNFLCQHHVLLHDEVQFVPHTLYLQDSLHMSVHVSVPTCVYSCVYYYIGSYIRC